MEDLFTQFGDRTAADCGGRGIAAASLFEGLREKGFQVACHAHAAAILSVDFPSAAAELEAALSATTIPIEEIIAGGGGECRGTQRLRRALANRGWPKFTFTVERRINGVRSESVSHEIDHVRCLPGGRLALEIEWNNKDPFYDRDLENFKRLHADGAISVGIIVTRGKSLHDNMRLMVRRFLDDRGIDGLGELVRFGYSPTAKQRAAIDRRTERTRTPVSFRDAFVEKFVADKFGEATTHWRKLEDRVHRGVGNPCPLVLIGLPESVVTFDEARADYDVCDAEDSIRI
jgi:hypothetical protein